MKDKISFDLTRKEKEVISEFLSIWRNQKFKSGEIVIPFHNYEPQEIIYKQKKRLGVDKVVGF